jgi:phosphinothricin acetyltransferase
MNKIRIAHADEAEAILKIYSPFILSSGITQEWIIPSVEEFRQRIISTLKERPWLVAEIDGEVAGYAYAGKHRNRTGYQWCTETSVYVAEKFYRRGIAHALYSALFDLLELQGYVNAYAVITLPNPGSISFHENFGFTYFATFKNIGYKLGRWHDVGWWHKQIKPAYTETSPPVPFPALDIKKAETILGSASQLLK